MPLILPDRQLLIPDGARANFSHVLEPDLLWIPHQGDLVRDPPTGNFDQFLTYDCPAGLALEKTNSSYNHYVGKVSSRLANSDYLTAGAICRVRQTTSSSPYRHPIFSSENTQSGSSGFGFYFGGGSSTNSKRPSVRDYDSVNSYWRTLTASSDFDANTWYLLLYSRGPDEPRGIYGIAYRFMVWRYGVAGYEYDSTWPATIYRTPFGGEGNNWALGSCADGTGYCYCQVAMAFVSPTPFIQLETLAESIFDVLSPRRERYCVPSYGGTFVGSGGIAFSGEAATETNFALTHEYTGSGGLTLAGTAGVALVYAALPPTGGLTLASGATTEIEEAPDPYSIGARIELQSNATYAVTATIELRPTTYAITATIELRSNAAYAITAGIALYADTAAAAAESAVAWRPYILLNGTDISARLTGQVAIEREEDAAPLARFTWVPTPGAIDPLAYLGNTVQIWWQHLTTAGAERYRRLRFTGLVSHTRWSPDRRVLDFECTSDLQTLLERMAAAHIADIIPGSCWSEHVFNSERTGWEIALDRLSTTELCLWQDVDGSIRTSSIRAAAAPDYTFTDDSRFADSLRLEYGSRRDVVNQITLTMDYRFPRKRHRQISFSWMPYSGFGSAGSSGSGSVCQYLENPYPLCSRAMVASAATGTEWVIQGDINYVEVWPPGLYMCGFANSEPRVWGFTETQITTTIETPGNPIGTYTYKVAQDFRPPRTTASPPRPVTTTGRTRWTTRGRRVAPRSLRAVTTSSTAPTTTRWTAPRWRPRRSPRSPPPAATSCAPTAPRR